MIKFWRKHFYSFWELFGLKRNFINLLKMLMACVGYVSLMYFIDAAVFGTDHNTVDVLFLIVGIMLILQGLYRETSA